MSDHTQRITIATAYREGKNLELAGAGAHLGFTVAVASLTGKPVLFGTKGLAE
jgi:hypothetical protein